MPFALKPALAVAIEALSPSAGAVAILPTSPASEWSRQPRREPAFDGARSTVPGTDLLFIAILLALSATGLSLVPFAH